MALGARLEIETLEQRRRAVRALLAQPLLVAADGRDFALVRRHASWLKEWFARHTGWSLVVSSELARLRKVAPEVDDGTRPLRDVKSGAPFSRRHYVLSCLALAALERSERQTTLGNIAKEVLRLAADDRIASSGFVFALQGRQERRELVQVIRVLLAWGVLRRVHGSEEQYLEQRGDALYNVERQVLAALLGCNRGPSLVEPDEAQSVAAAPVSGGSERARRRAEALIAEPVFDSDEARNRAIRWRLTRRLLEDPVLYVDTLDDSEREYLASQRGHVLRNLEHATGLVAEVRAEGIALVDPSGELSDVALPEEGTAGHVALLVTEFLVAQTDARAGATSPVAITRIEEHVAELAGVHGRRWRRDAREPGAERALTRATLERLEALGLVCLERRGVVVLPALARFALSETP